MINVIGRGRLTVKKTRAEMIITIGAKFTWVFSMVVVQQKSKGSRNWSGGPKGGTTGGYEEAFVFGFGTTQKSCDQIRTWTSNVLSGKYITARRKLTITRPQ